MNQAKSNEQRLERTILYFLYVSNTIRLVIVLMALLFHLFLQKDFGIFLQRDFGISNFADFDSITLYTWAAIYSILIITIAFYPEWQQSESDLPSIVSLFDILMMVILMTLAGGIHSGFGILVLTMVLTSCLNNAGKNSLVYSAFASILILLTSIFTFDTRHFFHVNPNYSYNLFPAGLLSSFCFFISIFASFASRGIRKSISEISKKDKDIARLNKLNRLIINYSQTITLVIDKDCRIHLFNNTAQKAFPDLIAGVRYRLFSPIIKFWNQNHSLQFDFEYEIAGDQMFIKAQPLVEHTPPLLLLFIRPASDLAAEAHDLKLSALGQLTANLAHEIRNPLSAISHANELLKEYNHDEGDEHLKSIIEQNTNRINKMVSEVLMVNKKNQSNPQYINCKTFIDKFISNFILTKPDSKNCISLNQIDSQVEIYVDEEHLHQILINLLSNAWKFCLKTKNAIQINIAFLANEELVQICVKDNGLEMEATVLPHIFEPFFTRSQGGTGLGLYIAQQLALSNNGKLRYIPGTKTFELTLKARKL